jgi:hypothetical protein
MSYHDYSPMPSGGLWETEEGTCNTSESEAARTRVQRASSSSTIKSVLRPDPSTSSSRKCRTPTGLVSSYGVDPAFEQLRCHGHRHCKRRRAVSAAKHQIPNSRSRSPQSLQLSSKLFGGLVQLISQSGSTGQWPEELVADPHGKPLKP